MLKEILEAVGRLFRWWYTCAPWEQSIRVRAGKHVRPLGAGIHLRIPYLDRVYLQSTRRRLVAVRSQTLTTADGRALTVAGCIGYEINDLLRLYQALHDAQDTIESEVCGIVARYVTARALADCHPRDLEEHVSVEVDLKRYGLSAGEFVVTNFVSVRTLRLITGEVEAWSNTSDTLETAEEIA